MRLSVCMHDNINKHCPSIIKFAHNLLMKIITSYKFINMQIRLLSLEQYILYITLT